MGALGNGLPVRSPGEAGHPQCREIGRRNISGTQARRFGTQGGACGEVSARGGEPAAPGRSGGAEAAELPALASTKSHTLRRPSSGCGYSQTAPSANRGKITECGSLATQHDFDPRQPSSRICGAHRGGAAPCRGSDSPGCRPRLSGGYRCPSRQLDTQQVHGRQASACRVHCQKSILQRDYSQQAGLFRFAEYHRCGELFPL